MVLYTIKNLLPLKDILKTLPSSGINNYIKILQRQCSRKTAVKELCTMKTMCPPGYQHNGFVATHVPKCTLFS